MFCRGTIFREIFRFGQHAAFATILLLQRVPATSRFLLAVASFAAPPSSGKAVPRFLSWLAPRAPQLDACSRKQNALIPQRGLPTAAPSGTLFCKRNRFLQSQPIRNRPANCSLDS